MDINSLAHTKWNCKYHIVFAPKYRRKIIYGQLKRDLGNFHFKEGGQNYHSVGEVDEIQVIIQDSGSVKAPEYSHTANRSYDLVPTYDYMYFDGIYFRNKMNDEKLYKVARFEIGALYEIGRILAENGIR